MSQIVVCPAYVSSRHSTGVLAGHHAKVIQIELRRDIIGAYQRCRSWGQKGRTITAPHNYGSFKCFVRDRMKSTRELKKEARGQGSHPRGNKSSPNLLSRYFYLFVLLFFLGKQCSIFHRCFLSRTIVFFCTRRDASVIMRYTRSEMRK